MENATQLVTLKATVLGFDYEWRVSIQASPLVIEAARKGYQEWLQDAASTAKPANDLESDADGKATKACRKRCMDERDQKIKDGTYKPGQGGGGARQGPQEKAWIAYFTAMGHKEGGKPVSGKTLKRAQETLCRQWLLEQYDPGSKERKELADNMKKHVAERFNDFIEHKEESDLVLKMGIEYQKALAAMPNMG